MPPVNSGRELHTQNTQDNLLTQDELKPIEKLRIGRGELPDDYYCSITCEVMSDPVIAADGYSYERVAIE